MQFDNIYEKYAPKVFRICLGYTNNYDQAKDLTQDTFIAVWENLNDFRGDSSLATWIFRIASNKCLRALDKEKRHERLIKTLPTNDAETIEIDTNDAKLTVLRNCIAELPETHRLIIGMYMEDIPQEKIAEILGISHANVRVKIHRIKLTLTEKLKHDAAV